MEYEIDKVAADIDMGRHDGNLSGIFNALRRRMADNAVDLVWRIDIDGFGFELDDMSGLALEAAEDAMGKSMHALNPEESVREWKALVAAHMVIDRAASETDVEALLRRVRLDDIVKSVSWREVNPSPKGTSGL